MERRAKTSATTAITGAQRSATPNKPPLKATWTSDSIPGGGDLGR
jgi:hypothetical protein